MDPLSAIASVIGIIQGVATTKHLVSLLRSIPGIQKEYDDLQRELVVLDFMVKNASRETAPVAITALLQENLDQLLADFREVEQKCSTLARDGKNTRAKKLRWLVEGNTMQKLRERASRAKQDLGIVLGLGQRNVVEHMLQQQIKHQQQFEALITQHQGLVNMFIDQGGSKDSGRVQELPDNEQDEKFQDDITNSEPKNDAQDTSNTGVFPIQNPLSDQFPSWFDTTILQRIQPLTRSGCSERCQCPCHFDTTSSGNTSWVQSALGSWCLRYNTLPTARDKVCISSCKRRTHVGLTIEYQPPKWFRSAWPRIDTIRLLRSRQVISTNNNVWYLMSNPRQEICTFMETGFFFFPDDEVEQGMGIVEYALQQEAWEFLEILLHVVWKNLLPKQGLPRTLFFAANIMLENWRLGEREKYLVRLIRSWADDGEEERRTQLFETILQEGDVEEAIERQPWAVGVLDYTGVAPLHLAAENNDVTTIDALIKANADVDQKDYDGYTPLMFAAQCNSLEAAKRLVSAGCSIDATNFEGLTAPHSAVQYSSHDLVEFLLGAGALPNTKSSLGDTCLHYLARSRADGNIVAKNFELLMAAGADLEAKDNWGMTPVLEALGGNNVPLLRCLFQAGASPYAIGNYSGNILHFAALYANAKTLQFLRDQKLVGINEHHQDEDGDSPWSTFLWLSEVPVGQPLIFRRPSDQEKDLFVQLYREIRDRNLDHDINVLQQVGQCLSQTDIKSALRAIAPLIKKMDEWNQDDMLFLCMDVQQHIDNSNWRTAMNMVNRCIELLREIQDSSPWDQLRYTYTPSAPQEDFTGSSGEDEDEDEDDGDGAEG